MSDHSNEQGLDPEIGRRFEAEPILIRRMATVAKNAGMLEFFSDMHAEGFEPKQLHSALVQRLRDDDVCDPEGIMDLFEVNMYD